MDSKALKSTTDEILTPSEPFKSTVSDLIAYEFSNPLQSEEMIEEIIDFQKKWNILKTKMAPGWLEGIQRTFRDKYCDVNTDPLEEAGAEQKLQETQNIRQLLEFFDKVLQEGAELGCCGLIEKHIVQEAHKIAVCGKSVKEGCTQPGEFSTNERLTTHHSFKGEYRYRQPEDMVKEVDVILDRFNSLITDAFGKCDERERVNGIFKSLAWFLFEILDLHPFGNGNGRLFRTSCNYVLLSCGQTVVPSPVYNVCTNTKKNDHSTCGKPCKDTYELALINARKRTSRHPKELASILLESCWRSWKEFMELIN